MLGVAHVRGGVALFTVSETVLLTGAYFVVSAGINVVVNVCVPALSVVPLAGL